MGAFSGFFAFGDLFSALRELLSRAVPDKPKLQSYYSWRKAQQAAKEVLKDQSHAAATMHDNISLTLDKIKPKLMQAISKSSALGYFQQMQQGQYTSQQQAASQQAMMNAQSQYNSAKGYLQSVQQQGMGTLLGPAPADIAAGDKIEFSMGADGSKKIMSVNGISHGYTSVTVEDNFDAGEAAVEDTPVPGEAVDAEIPASDAKALAVTGSPQFGAYLPVGNAPQIFATTSVPMWTSNQEAIAQMKMAANNYKPKPLKKPTVAQVEETKSRMICLKAQKHTPEVGGTDAE
jgi:hypothetical protein